jgi:hypothetical protein
MSSNVALGDCRALPDPDDPGMGVRALDGSCGLLDLIE